MPMSSGRVPVACSRFSTARHIIAWGTRAGRRGWCGRHIIALYNGEAAWVYRGVYGCCEHIRILARASPACLYEVHMGVYGGTIVTSASSREPLMLSASLSASLPYWPRVAGKIPGGKIDASEMPEVFMILSWNSSERSVKHLVERASIVVLGAAWGGRAALAAPGFDGNVPVIEGNRPCLI